MSRSQSSERVLLRTLIVALACGLVAMPAAAQSHWGVSFSVTPQWNLAGQLEEIIEDEDATIDLKGSEFTVGVVRGSTLGGDWGVSFVRKPFKDGSTIEIFDEDCFQNICLPSRETNVMQGVTLNGVEFDWFARFVNIRERVQLGLNVGGGIASVSGDIVQTNERVVPTSFDPRTCAFTTSTVRTVDTLDASEELLSMFPLLKVEAAGSIIMAPGFKLRIAGGLNFPAYSVRVGLVYLIGAQ